VVSSIREVHQLTDAHGRMRPSLKTLLKLEGDLRWPADPADTLPERILTLPGSASPPERAGGGDRWRYL
jgi:hypothetical protein